MLNILTKITHWFHDVSFRRLLKNAGILLSGNLGAALFDLVTLALTARALGPEAFGVLILIQTYVRVVDALVNFQSWQAIIKYGADSIVAKNHNDFKSLIKFGTLMDLVSAVIGAAIGAMGVLLVSRWMEWDVQEIFLAQIYCIVIAFNLIGTPTAVLRLYDRFKWLAAQQVSVSILKMILVIILFALGADFLAFLVVWIVMAIIDYMSLIVLGWRELKTQGYEKILLSRVRDIRSKHAGIVKFMVTTNLSSSIRLGAKEFDVLLVGALIGSASAGIYKIAKQFGNIPPRLGGPLQQSIYPDLAKLWASGSIEKFRNFIFRIGFLSGLAGLGIWLVFVVAGELILDVTVGREFSEAYPVLLVYMIGYCIFMFGISFRPAILSIGHPERILLIYTISTVVYFIFLVLLLDKMGIMGAAYAQIIFHSIWFIAMLISVVQFIKKSVKEMSPG